MAIKLLKYVWLFVVGLILLFFINQIIQFAGVLSGIHPLAGQFFLLVITILIVIFAIHTYIKIKKYPASLEKPKFGNPEEIEEYQRNVLLRLQKNKLLKVNGIHPEKIEDLDEALKVLNAEAEKIIRDNGSWVFVSTAISQNGKLDGLITLFLQLKMIYQISKIYYQKPRTKELYKLYSNVLVTVFLVSQIEELDIAEHLEPVVSKINPGELIPGIGKGIGLLTNMLFEGSANCFLTLRIGLITKEFCNFQNFASEKEIRSNCTKEAAVILGSIISKNSGKITKAFLRVVGKIGTKTVVGTGVKIKDTILKPFKK